METRTCRTCKEAFPLTEDFFYKNNNGKGYFNFRTECKVCSNEKRKYNRSLKRVKEEQVKKDTWLETEKNKLHLCKWCEKEKTLDEMRINRTRKSVESMCKKCFNKRSKEIYKPNHEANVFVKVLEERRRDKNERT